MSPKIVIKKDVRIGTAVFVVEGKDEFKLLERLFCGVYGFTIEQSRHNRPGFSKLVSNIGRIIIVNARNSNISFIEDFADFFDEIYEKVFLKHGIDIRYSPVYYLWDRDLESNTQITLDFVKSHNEPRNEENYLDGLLLISYPQIEAYVISGHECIEMNFTTGGRTLKSYIKARRYSVRNVFSQNNLTLSGINMVRALQQIGILFDTNDSERIKKIQPEVFEKEEKLYHDSGAYLPLSMLDCALIDLGLMEIIF